MYVLCIKLYTLQVLYNILSLHVVSALLHSSTVIRRILYTAVYTRGVNRAEISGPARN